MKKLNLASGQRPFPAPWINVDLIKQFDSSGKEYQMDIQADIRKLPMVEDNSCDLLVAHHCVEHIQLNDLLDTAREWHRILKPGGKLAVFVPNARALAEAWLAGRIDNFIFLVNMYGAYQGHYEDTHKWNFDHNELVDRLSGWDGKGRAIDWQVRDIDHNVLSEPIYQGSNCSLDWWILAVEFTKKG